MERELGSQRVEVMDGPHSGERGTLLRSQGKVLVIALDSGETIEVSVARYVPDHADLHRERGS